MTPEMTEIHVRLLNEGVDTVKRVPARALDNNEYRIILPEDYDAEDEEWEFTPGTIVRCEEVENGWAEPLILQWRRFLMFSRVMRKSLIGCFLVLCNASSANAYSWLSLKVPFETELNWHIQAVRSNDSASISVCFIAPAEMRPHCKEYNEKERIGYVRKLIVVPKPHLIELVLDFEDETSKLTKVLYWRYQIGCECFQAAGDVAFSEQGEYLLKDGMLFTAQAVLKENETRYAAHHFIIMGYRFAAGKWEKALEYETPQKYPSLDQVDKIDVLSHEMLSISARMK